MQIDKTSWIMANVEFGQNIEIGCFTVIGAQLPKAWASPKNDITLIGNSCSIGNHVVIYEGSKISDECFIDDYCRIGSDSIIGRNSMILYGAKIYQDVQIGKGCRIGGFCCNRTSIGNNVTMMGRLIHSYREPFGEWSKNEVSPVVQDESIIGCGALIVGDVIIHKNSYVAAGAIVTKSVPSHHIAVGADIIHLEDWHGTLTSDIFFVEMENPY